jgi:hypothetical protein
MTNYPKELLSEINLKCPNILDKTKVFLSPSERKTFIEILNRHGLVDISCRKMPAARYLVQNDLMALPKCPNPTCNHEIKLKQVYCCAACYKADPASKLKISEIKTKLYSDPVWKEKTEQIRMATNVERHGCPHPMQNAEFFEAHEKSSYQASEYKGMRGLRGYEPIVLDYFISMGYEPNKDIINGSTALTRYGWKFVSDKGNYQIPDFFIPVLNLFIEVKSEYTLSLSYEKIKILPDLIDDVCGGDYIVVVVEKNKLYEYNLEKKTSKPFDFSRVPGPTLLRLNAKTKLTDEEIENFLQQCADGARFSCDIP